MTYLIFDSLSKLTKIGSTKDIQSRMCTLSTSNLNLHLIYCTDANVEKLLHKIYKDRKVKKEWFQLTFQDVENIIELIETKFYK